MFEQRVCHLNRRHATAGPSEYPYFVMYTWAVVLSDCTRTGYPDFRGGTFLYKRSFTRNRIGASPDFINDLLAGEMMREVFFAMCVCVFAAGAARAEVVSLSLPESGTHLSGAIFTTSGVVLSNGATIDIQYSLNAFATDEITVDAFIGSDGLYFGVGSAADGTSGGQQQSVDGDDGEQLSISDLSITNFNAGASGLVEGDLSISFETVTILNGNHAPDGIDFSFVGFGDTVANVTSPGNVSTPATIDLTSLSNFSPLSSELYLQPDNAAANNRWSVSGIGVSVTAVAVPEPSSLCLMGLSSVVLLVRRRNRG